MASKKTLLSLAALLGLDGCIPIQEITWKNESYDLLDKVVRNETAEEESNYIIGEASQNGELKLRAWYKTNENNYSISETFQVDKQRKYLTGRNVGLAVTTDIGFGLMTLGTFLLIEKVTSSPGYALYYYDYSPEFWIGLISIGTGTITTLLSGPSYWGSPPKTRSTEKYRTLEEPLADCHCAMGGYRRQLTQSTVLDKVPAINLGLHLQSSDFIFENGEDSLDIVTNVEGEASTHLKPARDTLVYAVKDYENSPLLRSFQKRGYSPRKMLPLLESAAVPVTYSITVESKGKDGKAYSTPISVGAFEIKPDALEQIVLGL
ncbi:hypothetical protein HZA99_03080 [Candidatus Woesearchaeota archaeon]|nr:hypothetical protein [Candidatus Woesearchaeota archaeon]